MNAEIITIGDEILIGQIVDTNSAWLAAELTKIGFRVSQITSVSDNESAIKNAITFALNSNKLVVITGGLGPTKDDITKSVLCQLFNTNLEFNETVYSDVEAFLTMRGVGMNSLNRDQALFPKNCTLLRNYQGTAPGMWFVQGEKVVISLPGVPWEMKGIFKSEIELKLSAHFELPQNYYQTVMISGIGESQLAILLDEWEQKLYPEIKVAYLPSPGMIRLRLGITGNKNSDLQKIIEIEIQKLHHIIPNYLVSDIELTLQEIVGNLLKANNKTIVTAESCTGGAIAKLITSVPGSSKYFKGSVIAYSNEVKNQILNVDLKTINEFGAVSQQVVEQMAQGAQKLMKSDYAIAISGIAGPDGGTDEKPIGTVWIAVSDAKKTVSSKFKFGNERLINIERASITALNFARKIILDDI